MVANHDGGNYSYVVVTITVFMKSSLHVNVNFFDDLYISHTATSHLSSNLFIQLRVMT